MKIEKKEVGWWIEVTTDNGGHGMPISDKDYEELKLYFQARELLDASTAH